MESSHFSNWWQIYLTIAIVASGVTAITTPIARVVARRFDFLDTPLGEFHKKHETAMPVLGGAAMLTGWLITVFGGLAAALLVRDRLDPAVAAQLQGVRQVLPLLLVIATGAGILAVVGLIDDKRHLGPFVKLAFQIIICGCVSIYPKVRVTLVVLDQPVLSWFITVCWLLFILNAFNFFDNMDGLASGMAVIACTLFFVVAAIRHQYFVATLGAATAGTALGFYFYNRYPATIFMGDSGSHFLGFLLAILGSLTVFYNPESSSNMASLLIPLFILALPVFDTFALMVIRTRAGKPFYYGDHNHISHRFVRMGMDRPTAVLVVQFLALAIGLGALFLLWLGTVGTILVLIQSFVMLTLVTILHRSCKNGNEG